jgi:hypothetical protein
MGQRNAIGGPIRQTDDVLDPMFDAKIDAPTIHQLRLRPARK